MNETVCQKHSIIRIASHDLVCGDVRYGELHEVAQPRNGLRQAVAHGEGGGRRGRGRAGQVAAVLEDVEPGPGDFRN